MIMEALLSGDKETRVWLTYGAAKQSRPNEHTELKSTLNGREQ